MGFTETVLDGLATLRRLDPDLKRFGAASHRYELNPVLSESEICSFENEHGVTLPADYRRYFTEVGNGGAGPFYGLFELGWFDAAGSGDEPWREGDGTVGFLTRPFPHRERWVPPDEFAAPPDHFESDDARHRWYARSDEVIHAPELVNGAFPICHHGCALRTYLVVSGPQRGHVWLDARAEARGLVPHEASDGRRRTFAAWYLDWLQTSLADLGA